MSSQLLLVRGLGVFRAALAPLEGVADPVREPVPQPTKSAGTPAPATPLWQGLLTSAVLGVNSSNMLTAAAVEGFATEFVAQARQRLSGDRLSATLRDLSQGDHLTQLQAGLTGGMTAGLVSPVTDLLGLGVLAEQAPRIAMGLAQKAWAGAGSLATEIAQLGQDFAAFKAEATVKLKQIIADPSKLVEIAAMIGPQGKAAAHDAGVAAARTVVGLFESAPEKEHKPPASFRDALTSVKEGDLSGPFSLLTTRATNVREFVFRAPWAKTGYDVGHTVGAVVSNLLLFVFSDGIGNALAKIGAWIGEIAPLLARGAEGLAALGRGIAAGEALIGKIISKGVSAIKPLEALLAPLFKLLGRFQGLLRRFAGVAEHGAERALTKGAVAATEGALERGGAERAAASKGAAPAPKGAVTPLKRANPPPRSAVSQAQEASLKKVPQGRGDVHRTKPAAPPSSEAAAAAQAQEHVLEDAVSEPVQLAKTGTGDSGRAVASAKTPGKPKLSVVKSPKPSTPSPGSAPKRAAASPPAVKPSAASLVKPPRNVSKEVLEEFAEAQGRAGGAVEQDLVAGLSERPLFQQPSRAGRVITTETPKALKDPTFHALMDHVTLAEERFAAEGFTHNQTEAIKKLTTAEARNSARARYYGERIDTFVKETLPSDPRLNRLGISEIKQPGPDFFDPLRDRWYDLTTSKSWAAHVKKYGIGGFGAHAPTGR